jgi:hypothetical protein
MSEVVSQLSSDVEAFSRGLLTGFDVDKNIKKLVETINAVKPFIILILYLYIIPEV